MAKDDHASHQSETLTASQAITEYLFLRLRTSEGIYFEDFAKRFDEDFLSRFESSINTLAKQKFIEIDEVGIRLPKEKTINADSVISELVAVI